MSNENNRDGGTLTSLERELRLLADTIPTLVWTAGPGGDIEYVNKRVLEYLGATLDDIVGWGWAERVHPEDAAFKVRNWLKTLETKTPHDVVCRFRGMDGQYRWFNVRGEPLRAADGTVLRWYGVLIDIDDQRTAEEALREREDELRQIVEAVPGLLWSTAPDGEPTHICQRMLDYSGMRFEDFKHRGWEAFVHPVDLPRSATAYDRAIQTGTSYQGVMRLRRADGEFHWHQVRSEPLRDGQGRIIQWYGLSIDIDEATNAEEQPRSAAQLQATLNVIPAHTWYAAPSGALMFVNNPTADYLGLPKDHPLRFGIDTGAPWDAHIPFLHPDDQEGSRETWPANIRTGEASEYSFRVRNAQGAYRWFLSRVEPLRAADGTLLQWVGVNLDIEELKSTEQALRESEYTLRQITETVPGLIWSNGPDGEPTHVNRRMLDYSGMRFEEFKQRGWEAFVHPADYPETAKGFYHSVQTGIAYEGVMRLRGADGEFRWHHSRCEPLRDRQGNIIQWYGLSVDIDQRKRAEDRLRRSEAHLTEAQRLSRCGASVYNHSQILYWSEETYRIWGFDAAQGIPSREAVLQRVHPEDQDRVRADAERSFGEKKGPIGYRIVLPDGTAKHLESISQPTFSASGELVEVVATHADVTERKRAEQALRQSEAYLAEAQQLGHTASAAYNDTTILYWSDEYYRIFEFDLRNGLPSRGEAIQRIHPADRERVIEEARRAVRQKRDYKLEFRIVTPAPDVKYMEQFSHPKFSVSGDLVEVVSTLIDVTERKRVENALRASEGKFRDYAETASDWFWEIGPDYKFTLLTENAFGSRPADRIGAACWDHALDLDTEPEKWRLLWATLDSREPFRDFVYLGLSGNDSPMYVKASGKPVFDANREFCGYRGTGTDVTPLVRAQEEHERLRQLESDLAHMNRLSMMGELAASLAHEIAQPIATSRNNARAAMHFLERGPSDLGQVKEALGCVVDDADRAGEILDRIRDHIKKAPPRKERVDLNQAINDVIALAQGAIIKNGVSVQTRLTGGLPHVQADRVQLQQVALNLILNAVEAMSSAEPGMRELSISTVQHQAGGALVTVRDSGPGIDPEHLDRVFDAFYTTKSTGVGMGLSICRSIIHAHGGRLWVDVKASRGAVFRFTLPGLDKEFTKSLRPAHPTREPYEDTVSDAAHQPACEGNKPPRRSGRGRAQCRRGRQ